MSPDNPEGLLNGDPVSCPTWVRIFVPVCLGLYFLIGYARIRTTEWVPFSAWALFVFVPNQPSTYAVRLLALQGKQFEPPLDLEKAEGVVANPHDITAYFLINKLGAAWEREDLNAAKGFRKLLEANSLPKGMEWELKKTTYDPLLRWHTGIRAEKGLARFTASLGYD